MSINLEWIKKAQLEYAKNMPANFCTVERFLLTAKEKVRLNFALKAEMERRGLPMLPKRHTTEDRFLANQYPPELLHFATLWYETPGNRCHSDMQTATMISDNSTAATWTC